MNVTTVIPMLTMVPNAIWHLAYAVSLPEPVALIVMGSLMLTIGNLQRRAALLAKETPRKQQSLKESW
jgi:hypothetical protein